MPKREKDEEKQRVLDAVIKNYPEIIEYYIREREDKGEQATTISSKKVADTEAWFVDHVRQFVAKYLAGTAFYSTPGDSLEEARQRVLFLKHVFEDQDGYRIFYPEGKAIQRELDMQLIFKLTWFGSTFDVNSEVNNGRGPVDFAVSFGSQNKSLVEFKLASNPQLKKNLANQVPIYETASGAKASLKVVCYFSTSELARVRKILEDLKMLDDPGIILIDLRSDNKPSASKA